MLDNQVHNCCAELSSQAFVLFDPCDRWGGPTPSFVQGHSAGSFRTGLPPGGDPFVYHGVTGSEYKHELALFPFLFLRLILGFFLFSGLSFFSSTIADLKATDKHCFEPFFSASGQTDISDPLPALGGLKLKSLNQLCTNCHTTRRCTCLFKNVSPLMTKGDMEVWS